MSFRFWIIIFVLLQNTILLMKNSSDSTFFFFLKKSSPVSYLRNFPPTWSSSICSQLSFHCQVVLKSFCGPTKWQLPVSAPSSFQVLTWIVTVITIVPSQAMIAMLSYRSLFENKVQLQRWCYGKKCSFWNWWNMIYELHTFYFCSSGDWTQRFMHARQALSHCEVEFH